MKCEKLFETIDSLNEKYLQFLIDVCNIESPTDYKEGVDRVGRFIIDKAKAKGWTVETQHQEISGDAIAITMNPDASGAAVCFSGHTDTVHPVGSFGEEIVRCEGNIICGPGVTDCKGGLVASFMAMDALERCGFKERPVKLLIQTDEENGSRNSNKTTIRYLGEKAKGCIAFLNTEPAKRDSFAISTKGIAKYRFRVTGIAEHSSRCQNGASAICEAAHKVCRLEEFKNPDEITCNCGLIQGGSAENTVPEFCNFTADFRYRTKEQRELIEKTVEEIAGTSFVKGTACSYTLASSRVPMEITDRNLELFNKVHDIHLENGLGDVKTIGLFGGTDAADITQMGIPCLDGFGLIGGKIHNLGEYAEIDSLAFAAKRMASVAYCIQ